MGAVVARLIQPFKNWNVSNRAHKVISKEKPRPAPTFSSTKKQIDLVNQLDPDYKDYAHKKDLKLDDYLKKVYVKSNDQLQNINSISNPDKPLPKGRNVQNEFEYGFYESSKVEVGKVSLRQVLEFIQNNKREPDKYTLNFIADKYKVDPKVVDNILEYYRIFEINEVKNNDIKEIFATTSQMSLRLGIRIPHTKTKPNDKQKGNEEKNEESSMKHIQHV